MDFPGNNWAMYMLHLLQPCEPQIETGVINIEPAYVEVWEHELSVTLTLIRSGGSDGEAIVNLESNDITAIAGDDYEAITDVVTFEDGETEKMLVVYIIDDHWQEIDEEFIVQIVSVTGAEMGDDLTTTIKILDDEKE